MNGWHSTTNVLRDGVLDKPLPLDPARQSRLLRARASSAMCSAPALVDIKGQLSDPSIPELSNRNSISPPSSGTNYAKQTVASDCSEADEQF